MSNDSTDEELVATLRKHLRNVERTLNALEEKGLNISVTVAREDDIIWFARAVITETRYL